MRDFPRLTFFLTFVLPVVFALNLSGSASGVVAERIMAVVNGEVIALSDIRVYEALFRPGSGMDQKTILDEVIGEKVFLSEARKMEIARPEESEVSKAYQELLEAFGGPEAFSPVKKELGLSEEEVRHAIRDRLHVKKLVDQRIRAFVFVAPREAREYLIENPGAVSGLPEEEAEKVAEEAVKKIKTREKLENYLERLKEKSDILVIFPRK